MGSKGMVGKRGNFKGRVGIWIKMRFLFESEDRDVVGGRLGK